MASVRNEYQKGPALGFHPGHVQRRSSAMKKYVCLQVGEFNLGWVYHSGKLHAQVVGGYPHHVPAVAAALAEGAKAVGKCPG